MEFSDLWKSGPAVAVAIIGVVAALLKAVKTLLEFHDEYLSKRRFKRHAFLVSEAEQSSELKAFIKALKHEAIFRAAFGKPASPRKASAVMELYETGHFSHEELRESYLFLVLDAEGNLDIRIGVMGHLLQWFTTTFMAFIALYMISLVNSILSIKSLLSIVFVLLVLLSTFFIFWYFGRDVRSVLLAKRVRKKLEKLKAGELSSQSITTQRDDLPSAPEKSQNETSL